MVNHTHFQHWPRRFQHFQRRSSLPPALPLEGSLGLSCLENKCAKCVEIRNHFFQLESLEMSRCPNGFLKIIWKRCQKKHGLARWSFDWTCPFSHVTAFCFHFLIPPLVNLNFQMWFTLHAGEAKWRTSKGVKASYMRSSIPITYSTEQTWEDICKHLPRACKLNPCTLFQVRTSSPTAHWSLWNNIIPLFFISVGLLD
jgi:hypothetical protein